MKLRTLPLLALFLLSLALGACGAPPTADEAVGQTQSALNGHSAQEWTTTQPWLCYVNNPMTATSFPAYSWCTWQPDPNSDFLPYGVSKCVGSAPTKPGSIWVYQYQYFGGQCAEVMDPHGMSAPYQWDSDLVQANGWLNTYEGTTSIQSMKLGPFTSALLCNGPFTGPAGAPCQSRAIGLGGLQTVAVNYPTMIYSDGTFFATAAIQLQATAQYIVVP